MTFGDNRTCGRLGLIGGLGPAAGVYYYRRLVAASDRLGSPLNLTFSHADIRTVFDYIGAGAIDDLARYLSLLVGSLAAGGCDFAAVSAVMPHVCIAELQRCSPIPIVNLLESLRLELERQRIRRISLFGTKKVMESDLFGSLAGVEIVRAKEDELNRIDAAYRAMALRGSGTPEDRDAFDTIAAELTRRERLDAIVLAGTDLSVLFEESPLKVPAIDAANVHIAAILERFGER